MSGSEGSSNVHIFSVSWVWDSVSEWEESSRDPVKVSSDNEGEWKSSVWLVGGSLEFITNRISGSERGIVSNSQSSFNITSIGVEVLEGDDVEISEGVNSVVESDV